MGLVMYISRLGPEKLLRLIFAAYLAICLLCLFSPSVIGKTVVRHEPAAIEKAIKDYIAQQFSAKFKVETIVNKFDPRIQLTPCPKALQVFYPARAKRMGATTIGVQCISSKPWKIFVPVQIRVFGPAVVSRQSLPRGTILAEDDLTLEQREISTAMHGYFKNITEAMDMELRVSVAQGQIIGPKSLKPRHLVKRGDIVRIIAETEGLQIQIKGKALMNGYHGQSIRVKNTRSNRVLQGEVIATRTVKIKL